MIVILDFGSQYTQLIARRIRERKVYCEILPCNIDTEKIRDLGPEGIILSGGPESVLNADSPTIDTTIFGWGIPILGICYGMQLTVHLLGGKVTTAKHSEYGQAMLELQKANPLFEGFDHKEQHSVWMSHGDRVEKIPAGFVLTATSQNSPFASIANFEQRIYGVQFHPEVAHTKNGTRIIENFLFQICACKAEWTMESFIETTIKDVKEKVGKKNVICGLSGGVDSSVVAVLLHEAIGDQLVCIFVDNGLLRKGEAEKVVKTFRERYHIRLIHVDAAELFLQKLEGITDPEKKRKIIGNEFINVFEAEAKKLEDIEFLAQGTLYPDVIESVSFKGPSAVIKSHHNVGGLPEKMQLKLIEPVRELFKDEVRVLGKKLGMEDDMVYRQPFPGPGLGIRILGEITKDRLDVLKEADSIILEEIKQAGYYMKVWQSFAVLLPIKSVGVMGDDRTYEWTVVLRCVDSKDAMTADWSKLPYDLLGKISNRIVNEVSRINRVAYDITSKPPGTIEWE